MPNSLCSPARNFWVFAIPFAKKEPPPFTADAVGSAAQELLMPAISVSELTSAALFLLLLAALLRNGSRDANARIDLLDRKIDFLFERAGLVYDPIPQLTPTLRELTKKGKKIHAIKLYRTATGAGLRESKEAVERLTRLP